MFGRNERSSEGIPGRTADCEVFDRNDDDDGSSEVLPALMLMTRRNCMFAVVV